jgi:hypothetical protein
MGMSDSTETWPSNPLMVDQPEGFTREDPPLFVMQMRQPDGTWEIFNSPRTNRDEVTRIQAYHLTVNPHDTTVRVLKKVEAWVVEEVPGYAEGQTPPEEILARNEEITNRLLGKEESEQQPVHE